MNKKFLVMLCALGLVGSVFAQTAEAELKKTAAAPEIKKELRQPDGAAIFLKDDGSFQIFGRGTGTYDFDDADDLQDAIKEGEMKAKAALAKFMKEKLSTEEAFASASKKVKSITSSDGQTQASNVTKETIKSNSQIIRNSASAILKGVIVLSSEKIPRKGSSGEVLVTVGISSKTLKAVGRLVNALEATPEQGRPGVVKSTATGNSNKAEIRKAVTDF